MAEIYSPHGEGCPVKALKDLKFTRKTAVLVIIAAAVLLAALVLLCSGGGGMETTEERTDYMA